MGKWTETKIRPSKWRIKYVFYSKRRPIKMRSRIRAKQFGIKISNNSYKLVMKGRRR